ncbi:MAG: phosphatase PAP2 family protein [Actinomycetes bacterium]
MLLEHPGDAGRPTVEASAEPVTAADLRTTDRFFYALSSAADHGLLWLALGSVRAARRHDPAFALRLGLALGAESLFTNGAIKSLFRRVRPPEHFAHDAPLPYGMHRPITSSFPSGHATTAFTAASVLAPGSAAAPAWYALAALVAYSRVRVRMHHPADVVGGVALGLVLGRLARRFVRP